MKSKLSHLKITPDPAMECLGCGAKQTIPIPVYLDILVAMMKAFEKSHKHCQKSVENQNNDVLQPL